MVIVVVSLVEVEATKRLIAIDRHSMWITITCCRCCSGSFGRVGDSACRGHS